MCIYNLHFTVDGVRVYATSAILSFFLSFIFPLLCPYSCDDGRWCANGSFWQGGGHRAHCPLLATPLQGCYTWAADEGKLLKCLAHGILYFFLLSLNALVISTNPWYLIVIERIMLLKFSFTFCKKKIQEANINPRTIGFSFNHTNNHRELKAGVLTQFLSHVDTTHVFKSWSYM